MTYVVDALSCTEAVSIHTPTKGVTRALKVGRFAMLVSIHTPTKGVTSRTLDLLRYFSSFNPHTHEGCDVSSVETY